MRAQPTPDGVGAWLVFDSAGLEQREREREITRVHQEEGGKASIGMEPQHRDICVKVGTTYLGDDLRTTSHGIDILSY